MTFDPSQREGPGEGLPRGPSPQSPTGEMVAAATRGSVAAQPRQLG